tara:strand:- start:48973 stop:50007 length:1035 start_codon:yes stop_codon:yes gene_type:complete
MKKLMYVALGALLLASCAKDENSTINIYTEVDLTTVLPNSAYDNSQQGIYSGVIVANNTQFHGKLYLDIANNNNRYQALVQTIEGQKFAFNLVNMEDNIYSFGSDKGTFSVDISDYNNVVVSDISIDNASGTARLIKETNNSRAAIVLGTYTSACTDCPFMLSGTWDFMVEPPANPTDIANISEVIITTSGSEMKIDDDFEGTTPYCYTGGPYIPFFWEDSDPAENRYEIYATGQEWIQAGGNILHYDLAFSKTIADENELDYNRMLGFPELTNALFFDPPLDPAGCFNIAGTNGLWGLYNPAGDALLAAGFITFDTSGLVPVPPAPGLARPTAMPIAEINNMN